LPEHIPLTGKQGLIGFAYPALHLVDGLVNLRLFSGEKESAISHAQGVAALYAIHFADKLKQLKKNVALNAGMKAMATKVGNPKHLEQAIIDRIKKDLFLKHWRKQEDFIEHANTINSTILQYDRQICNSIEPVLKAFADTFDFISKLKTKNTGNSPVLKFLKDVLAELHSLVPVDFPDLYSFDRMKNLPRYCKALSLRAQRGSLNLATAENKMQEVIIYSQQLQEIIMTKEDCDTVWQAGIKELSRFIEDTLVDFSKEKKTKIEELFWMIEEYKVSLFAQELKTPYPVSPKKLNQLIKEIEIS
jgi:ATP-dependent helicase HrpA